MRLLLLSLSLLSCAAPKPVVTPPPPAPEAPKGNPLQKNVQAEDYIAPPLPVAQVVLEGRDGLTRVEAEVANTSASISRGLMWRRTLDEGKGMLFVYGGPSTMKFWMKNTLISLDMIFITQELRVLGVVERAVPNSLESLGFAEPSMYVLEVPGGYAQKIGLKAGSKVELLGLPK